MSNDDIDSKKRQPTAIVKPGDDPDSGSALHRWSARKLRSRQVAEAATTLPAGDESDANPAAAETKPAGAAERELTDADMPALDSIDETTDVSGFFSPKVSAELRRQALRKLFHLPIYNIRDGLNDYDDDYTKFESLGDVVTSDMRHMEEVKERMRREAELASQQEAAAAEDTAEQMGDESQPQLTDEPAEVDEAATEVEPSPAPGDAPGRST